MPPGIYTRHVKRHAVVQPLDTGYRYIPLTQGQNAIVDTADFEWLNEFNWFAYWSRQTQTFYAAKQISHRLTGMHSFILNCKIGERVDHVNNNTLDNRRENLRKATAAENSRNCRISKRNVSGFKGVHFRKEFGTWRACIRYEYVLRHLGSFDSAEEAAKAYDHAAIELFGEFAHLNFPRLG
jgi:hypothetical protein